MALEFLKAGAGEASSLLRLISAQGFANLVGFGWLAAYVSLSGSPVAALSLGLFAGGALSPAETLGMINGSRLGASFIVLVAGFVYYMRGGQRGRGVISMGVLAMLVTATVYTPAMLLAVRMVGWDAFKAFTIPVPRWTVSVVDLVVDPVVGMVPDGTAAIVSLIVGYAGLLLAFRLFDRALPQFDSRRLQEGRLGSWIYRPATMFLIGLAVTSMTLSVSVSLSILVPLASRGVVNRWQVIPYIMGCNITTFIDTLVAAMLLRRPGAPTIVLAEIVSVATVSLLILFTIYPWYQRGLLALNGALASTKVRFALFVGLLAIVPLVLLFS